MENNRLHITRIDHLRLTSLVKKERNKNRSDIENIRKLSDELRKAIIVDPENIDPDVATMNSVIKFTDIESGKDMQLKIVYPEESDIKKRQVSILAPVGMALLGYRKGDIVEWNVPGGRKKFLINEILYQPEKSGDYLT